MTVQVSEPAVSLAPAASTPGDRAATFQAVPDGGETRSGPALLVEAYAVLWVIVMAWLWLLWRKQGRLHARLEELERAIDRAAAKAAKAAKADEVER